MQCHTTTFGLGTELPIAPCLYRTQMLSYYADGLRPADGVRPPQLRDAVEALLRTGPTEQAAVFGEWLRIAKSSSAGPPPGACMLLACGPVGV